MNCFSSMVNTLENLNSPKYNISKSDYEIFCKEYIFEHLRGVKFGKAFCKKFNINDTMLKCLFDEDLAKELIEEQYLE